MKLGKFKVSNIAIATSEMQALIDTMNVFDSHCDHETEITTIIAISDYFDDIDTDSSGDIFDQAPWYEFLLSYVDGETKMIEKTRMEFERIKK